MWLVTSIYPSLSLHFDVFSELADLNKSHHWIAHFKLPFTQTLWTIMLLLSLIFLRRCCLCKRNEWHIANLHVCANVKQWLSGRNAGPQQRLFIIVLVQPHIHSAADTREGRFSEGVICNWSIWVLRSNTFQYYYLDGHIHCIYKQLKHLM